MFRSRTERRCSFLWVGLLLATVSGCSSIRSLNGVPAVPAHRVPAELLGRPKSEMQEISMGRLRVDPPAVYQLAPGDILGVYIENVLGNADELPPFEIPDDPSQPPVIGYPAPVRENGTVSLPMVEPIDVAGLTLAQVQALIKKAYTVDNQILQPGKDRIMVALMRRRIYRVLVVREEAGGALGISKRGTGHTVDLPAYENDLMHALNETGGLPGMDAKNEILIYRGVFANAVERDKIVAEINAGQGPCEPKPELPDDPNVVRVPLRFYPDQMPDFSEEDIKLETGDIVMIRSRDEERYYTGGVLGSGEQQLPRDQDLDIMGAIAQAGGQIAATGSGIQALGGNRNGGGGYGGGGGGGNRGGGYGGGIVPATKVIVLRKVDGGGQIPIRIDLNRALVDPGQRILIQPDDVVILRYTWDEELLNAIFSLAQVNFLFNGFSGNGF